MYILSILPIGSKPPRTVVGPSRLMARLHVVVLLLGMLSMLGGWMLLGAPAWAEDPRDPTWATPVVVAGVGNLYKVSDELYRSAQPTDAGLKNLAELGIHTVIDLRHFHNDRQAAKEAKLLDEELSINTWNIQDSDVIQVMRLIGKHNGPYLIHCEHGSDRTGVMIAMYRIIYQKWSQDQAINEMVKGGYGFHSVWANIVSYVRKVDVAKLKKQIEQN